MEQPSSIEPVAPPMPPPSPTEQLRPRRESLAKEGWTLDPSPGVRTIDPSWLGYSHSAGVRSVVSPHAWSTAGVWLLALAPWLSITAGLLSVLLAVFIDPLIADVVAVAAFVVVMLLCVIIDRGQLAGWLHLRPASGLWILLGPFFYLLARTISVRRNVGRGAAPLIVYLVNVGVVWVGGAAVWYLLLR